jgi:hypothetical protein
MCRPSLDSGGFAAVIAFVIESDGSEASEEESRMTNTNEALALAKPKGAGLHEPAPYLYDWLF